MSTDEKIQSLRTILKWYNRNLRWLRENTDGKPSDYEQKLARELTLELNEYLDIQSNEQCTHTQKTSQTSIA